MQGLLIEIKLVRFGALDQVRGESLVRVLDRRVLLVDEHPFEVVKRHHDARDLLDLFALLGIALLLVILVVDPCALPVFVFDLQFFDVVMNRQNLAVNGALVVVDILLFYLNVFIHLSEFFVQ